MSRTGHATAGTSTSASTLTTTSTRRPSIQQPEIASTPSAAFLTTPPSSRPGTPILISSPTTYAMGDEKRADGYRLVIDPDVEGGGGKRTPASPGSGTLPSFLGNVQVGRGSMVDRIASNPALPVVCYCAASILMTVVNKFVVSGHNFTMNFLLLTIQSCVCVGCVAISKSLRVISYRDFDTNDARKWFPISFLLVVVIYTGSKALQFLSIPVYTIFKNLTIILIAYGEVIWFQGTVTRLTLLSFGLMVVSSLIAAWSDISSALFSAGTTLDPSTGREVVSEVKYGELMAKNAGYLWMLINCLASAAYVLAMRKRIKLTSFKDWDTMFYNNLLSIPVLVVFSILFEDWSVASLSRNFPPEGRTFLLCAMAFSGAAAVFISYTTAWCVRTTSSTTYSMVGALNKLPVAASGMIFFGDPVTFGSVTAITTGFVAGLVYAMAKTAQSAAARAMGNGGVELSTRPR